MGGGVPPLGLAPPHDICPGGRFPRGVFPRGMIPLGDDSPGGLSQGGDCPGRRFPRGGLSQWDDSPGERFPWGTISQGNDPAGPSGQGRGSRNPAVVGSNPAAPPCPGAQIRPRWPRMLRGRFWLQNQDFGASVGAICIIFRDLSVSPGGVNPPVSGSGPSPPPHPGTLGPVGTDVVRKTMQIAPTDTPKS